MAPASCLSFSGIFDLFTAIPVHEAIMTYDELRSKVLQMSVFSKTENNMKTHKPQAMDIDELTKRIHEIARQADESANTNQDKSSNPWLYSSGLYSV